MLNQNNKTMSPHHCHPCSSDVTLWGGEWASNASMTYQKKFQCCRARFSTHSFSFAWRIHLFVTWNGISSLWTVKPGSLNTVLDLADAPSGVCGCVLVSVRACEWRVQPPRVIRLFYVDGTDTFLDEKRARPCPLLCVQLRFNNLLHLINLHEYN